jgi:prepilin-type N-terminal cleavage/methylation domain-containing protein
MRQPPSNARQRGFSLIELLVALGIFLVVTGAAFTLLGSSQQRYKTESQVLNSFQEARLGLDQIVRDVNDAGYPPPSFFQSAYPNLSASWPFAWSSGAGYPSTFCQIGTAGSGTCTTAIGGDMAPGDFDIIIETNPNPQDSGGNVKWIRYQLQGTTLMRSVADKTAGDDPDSDTSATGKLFPFVQNVVNNASSTQIAQYQLFYPGMFPGGVPAPIFSYTCDSLSTPPPTVPCLGALGNNSPTNIRDVIITLIVAAPVPDATTGVPRLVQLSGRARRINPNQ